MIKVETAAVDAIGYIPESALEQIGELTYQDTRTGAIYVQEPDQVVMITAE